MNTVVNRFRITHDIGTSAQRGFSLVELLISVVLGLFILGGVIQIFASGKAAYNEMQRFGQVQSQIRFISDFLTKDIRGAELIAPFDPASPDPDSPILFPTVEISEVTASTGFSLSRQAGEAIDRDCRGEPRADDNNIHNTYRFRDGRLECWSRGDVFSVPADSDYVELLANVTEMGAVPLDSGLAPTTDWADAVALQVFIAFQTGMGSATRDHRFSFVVGLRNNILTRYNAR